MATAYKRITIPPDGEVNNDRFEEVLRGIKERITQADFPAPVENGNYIHKTGGFRAPSGLYGMGDLGDLLDYKKEHSDF